MNNLIERYIYDVISRLPEKDRDEVSKELKANISDMLSDSADESEIKSILVELGSPAALAEQYRSNPRYLISPAIYNDYIRALKWVLPLVGIICLVAGMIAGAFDTANATENSTKIITNVISTGISVGVSATFQTLVWITIGFVIADRSSVKAKPRQTANWTPEKLPEIPTSSSGQIPLSDSITGLVLTVVFTIVALLVCTGRLPLVFSLQNGSTRITSFFSSSFLTACIPVIIAMSLLGIIENLTKIKIRRWNPFVCGTVIVSNLLDMGFLLYLINRSDLLSSEFISFSQSFSQSNSGLEKLVKIVSQNNSILILSIIVIICCLAGVISALYKTIKYSK